MAHRVGDYLKQDPLKLRFTSSNPTTGAPKAIIKRALNQSVADITSTNYYAAHPNIIVYYELLDISIIELETKKSLKVIWTGQNNREEVSLGDQIRLSELTTFSRRIVSFYQKPIRSAMWRTRWQRT
jgi:ubiquitin carboxyl-terminal hydrolase 7